MSDVVEYDPTLFELQRASAASARLGQLILGVSRLGSAGAGGWVTVPAATVTFSANYTVDENGTLIVEADTVDVSLTFAGEPGDILYPGDRVRGRYDGGTFFIGRVDRTGIGYVAELTHGAARRVDFSASCVGVYAVAMGKTVEWDALPEEPWIDRIRRYVTVAGWA